MSDKHIKILSSYIWPLELFDLWCVALERGVSTIEIFNCVAFKSVIHVFE